MAIAFMLFGLGFFTLMTIVILRDDKVNYQRRLNEQREFGFRFNEKRKHN